MSKRRFSTGELKNLVSGNVLGIVIVISLHFSFQMDIHFPPFVVFRRKFSPDEDDMLRALVKKNGVGDWPAIAAQMPNRDSRQCKERWFHYLAPCLVQNPWTRADDVLLEGKVAEHGHRWKLFELFFPGRTDVNIKNRYNVLVRRRKRELAMLGRAIARAQPTSPEPLSPPEPITLKWEEPDWGFEGYEWADLFSA
jgi:hypothetical protein